MSWALRFLWAVGAVVAVGLTWSLCTATWMMVEGGYAAGQAAWALALNWGGWGVCLGLALGAVLVWFSDRR